MDNSEDFCYNSSSFFLLHQLVLRENSELSRVNMRGNVQSVERKEDWLILQHQYYIKIINSFGEVDENNFSNIRITVLFHYDDARIVNKASEVEIKSRETFSFHQ